MFTGLIEATGNIYSIDKTTNGAVIWVESAALDFSDISLGDSISVNGVCLTVVEIKLEAFRQQASQGFKVEASLETLQRTNFGDYETGQGVNLEKALLPTTRLGGHLVSGHVDGVGEVEKIFEKGNAREFIISAPQQLYRYIAEKGSICIDGISLTVNSVDVSGFRITIIPHTLKKTQMGQYKVGSRVNLEVDLLARYTEQLLKHGTTPLTTESLTIEKLLEAGFSKQK